MMPRSCNPWVLSVFVVLAAACGDDKPSTGATMGSGSAGSGNPTGADSESSTGGGTTTGGGATTTSGGTTTGTPDPTTGDGTNGTATTMAGFIIMPDGGISGQCDPRLQDCPEGQKCTAVSPAPGEPWGVNTCVQVMGEGAVGDPCDVEGGKYTGVDNCAKGTLCLLTDDEGLGGICVEFCDLNDQCPNTPTAKCVVYNDGSLPICLPTCDPLLQDCPEGQGCYSSAGDSFVCFKVSAEPGEGLPGDECEYLNACQKGGFCAAADAVANCPPQSAGCCTPFCPVSGGNAPCQPGEECVPFFEQGMAPPQYEDVGVCVIPG